MNDDALHGVRVLLEGKKGGIGVDILMWGDSAQVGQRAGLGVAAGPANGDVSPCR